ncbi:MULTISPECIES: helix-turn-helix transcriptional regulator [Mycolicibacterium]|uniref:Transcriptional regulator n=1 Tax=Mycolicibacterium elephantis TaxID=81858 RepID=A0A1A0QJV4_9MYCO|nr:HTH domain-containing protein [Mycolicibacterium elephantis]OBB22411.1 transcriptional regulator [Mycolicibacterium elephantis]OBE99169.1 transcriptional regulator [Mycolicibacterium elephantis]ORA65322.1 transcriptional regulator [Mycolicibacterium elephantis]
MDDEVPAAAARPRRDRLPRNRQRERVLHLVRKHDGPVDAAEIAAQIGLHVTTVRFHLDALCDEGAIVRTRLHRAGAGRPRTGYVAVEDRLDYRVLAEVLAMELGRTEETRRERAERAGRRWADQMVAAIEADVRPDAGPSEADALDRLATVAAQIFARMGFAPELLAAKRSRRKREREIRLHACPIRDLARSHPEVGCGLHRGVLAGLVRDTTMSAELEPFVAPELCLARVVSNE